MSATNWRERQDATRAQLAQRNAEHPTGIYLLIGEREACALAVGKVPRIVQQMARTAIDWEFTRPRRKRR